MFGIYRFISSSKVLFVDEETKWFLFARWRPLIDENSVDRSIPNKKLLLCAKDRIIQLGRFKDISNQTV